MMLSRSIRLTNLLSFGPDSDEIALKPLNLLIGPNGSGKSNLLEAFGLLRSTAGQISGPIREGGGVRDWLWKGGATTPVASLEIVAEPLFNNATMPVRYMLAFTESGKRFEIVDERLENAWALEGHSEPYFYYRYENNHPVLNARSEDGASPRRRDLRREDVDPELSILAQRKDPNSYPEITELAEKLSRIRIYRDWTFGRYTPPRMPQPADLTARELDENARNLGMFLNKLRRDPATKAKLVESFQAIYAEAVDFDIIVEGGTVQLYVQESGFNVPATRLSDGTLHYLSLIAILYDPDPPPLICIDEPELGLHPDLIGHVADALRYARERTQLVVTTHSAALVDAFTDEPGAVLVCEKDGGCTRIQRLDPEHLQPWLDKYRLGELWISGEIGGNRW